jgi:hypothetical protein
MSYRLRYQYLVLYREKRYHIGILQAPFYDTVDLLVHYPRTYLVRYEQEGKKYSTYFTCWSCRHGKQYENTIIRYTITISNTYDGDTETATMTSEASIPKPRNWFIYNKDTTKDGIPDNVTHVKVHPSVKEITQLVHL